MLSQVILTKDNPIADVVFGIDNTFLQRALDEDLFVPYRSPAVDAVPAELQLDAQDRVTPIDYGDVCVNYWIDATDGPPPGVTRGSHRSPPRRLVRHPEPRDIVSGAGVPAGHRGGVRHRRLGGLLGQAA